MMFHHRLLRKKGLFFLVPFLLGFFLLLSNHAQATTKAPQFALPSAIDGSLIDMKSYSGKVVLINFFTTWCPPCRQEIPTLNQLQEKYDAKGFSVIGISLDESSSKIVVKFIKKMKVNYPVAMADDKTTRDFGGVIGIPTSFLIDQKGNIAKRYDGYVTHDLLEKDIGSLLNTK